MTQATLIASARKTLLTKYWIDIATLRGRRIDKTPGKLIALADYKPVTTYELISAPCPGEARGTHLLRDAPREGGS